MKKDPQGGPLRRRTHNRFASPLATRISTLATFLQCRAADGSQSPRAMADDVLILIPARMAATRLPGKPLIDIAGTPMIVHVLRRAEAAKLGPVVVATDAEAIAACVEKAGGRAIMTRTDHPSGSDRIFEALGIVDPDAHAKIIINVQGDLPTISPADLKAALAPLKDTAVDIATLAAEIRKPEERTNPNVVKVVGSVVGARPAARTLFHARDRARRRRAALSPYRPLCLSPRRARAFRRVAAVAAREAREARATARAGGRHAHRCDDCRYRAARRRYAGGFGNRARNGAARTLTGRQPIGETEWP